MFFFSRRSRRSWTRPSRSPAQSLEWVLTSSCAVQMSRNTSTIIQNWCIARATGSDTAESGIERRVPNLSSALKSSRNHSTCHTILEPRFVTPRYDAADFDGEAIRGHPSRAPFPSTTKNDEKWCFWEICRRLHAKKRRQLYLRFSPFLEMNLQAVSEDLTLWFDFEIWECETISIWYSRSFTFFQESRTCNLESVEGSFNQIANGCQMLPNCISLWKFSEMIL